MYSFLYSFATGIRSGRGYKTFFVRMKFRLLIKLKYRQMKKFLDLSLSDVVFIILINVKMPTIVGILTFMSRIISCSAQLSKKKVL